MSGPSTRRTGGWGTPTASPARATTRPARATTTWGLPDQRPPRAHAVRRGAHHLHAAWTRFREQKFRWLLAACLVYTVTLSFFAEVPLLRMPVDILATSVFIAVLFAAGSYRPLAIATLPLLGALIGTGVVSELAHVVGGPQSFVLARTLLTLVIFVLGTVVLMRSVLRQERVTGDKVLGAICVYFLLGVVWGLGYLSLQAAHPGSFHVPRLDMRPGYEPTRDRYELRTADFVYFSFETITTLGSGDIRPTTVPAETLTWLEAATGQLYLAVLIARLVSLHIIHSSSPAAPNLPARRRRGHARHRQPHRAERVHPPRAPPPRPHPATR